MFVLTASTYADVALHSVNGLEGFPATVTVGGAKEKLKVKKV